MVSSSLCFPFPLFNSENPFHNSKDHLAIPNQADDQSTMSCPAVEEPRTNKNKVTFMTSNNQLFDLEPEIAMQFPVIKSFLDEDSLSDTPIPLPNVSSSSFAKIVDYTKHHLHSKSRAEAEEFDREFVDTDKEVIFDLVHAANYLNAAELLDLLNQNVADRIKDMTVEQVREFFSIENDFSPEEEAEYREAHKWAFE